jgi:hypothetical protein
MNFSLGDTVFEFRENIKGFVDEIWIDTYHNDSFNCTHSNQKHLFWNNEKYVALTRMILFEKISKISWVDKTYNK